MSVFPPHFSANTVHGAFRLRDDASGAGPLKLVDTRQGRTLEETCRRINTGQLSTKDILLTTGFGLSRRSEVPVRLPALLEPALRVMERCRDLGLPTPPYLVYQATDFIAETNGIPAAQAKEVSQRMAQYLQAYVSEFHGRITECVSFRFGCDYPPDTRAAVEEIATDIRARAETVPAIAETLRTLERCEARCSNQSGKSLPYAAANVLYNGGVAARFPFRDSEDVNRASVVLPIGGLPEKPFFHITSVFAAEDPSGKALIPLVSHIGSRPTYYPALEQGDPCSVEEYEKRGSIRDAAIRADFACMEASGVSPERLRDVFPSPSRP